MAHHVILDASPFNYNSDAKTIAIKTTTTGSSSHGNNNIFEIAIPDDNLYIKSIKIIIQYHIKAGSSINAYGLLTPGDWLNHMF